MAFFLFKIPPHQLLWQVGGGWRPRLGLAGGPVLLPGLLGGLVGLLLALGRGRK